MADDIVERVIREAGVGDLVEVLAERLGPTDLQSLLLEVYRRRAAQIDAAKLLEAYARNRFVQPSRAPVEALLAFDQLAFSLLPPAFEVLELSPVSPLGTNSVVATVDQNKAVSTARNTEVTSDSTNTLALECALRRRAVLRAHPRSAQRISLAASHRVLRAQRFDAPGQSVHFRLLGLCTAGRDQGDFRFECESLTEQLDFLLRLFDALPTRDEAPRSVRIDLTLMEEERRRETLERNMIEPLAAAHPRAALRFDPKRTSGRGYYRDLCFKLFAEDGKGGSLEIGDGGFVDWTQQLLANKKERLLIAGIGSERLCERARPPRG